MVDYSLYLVTGRELLPDGKDYLKSLEEALEGGVSIVQIREKNTDTADFIDIAKASQVLCKRYRVPLLINDRIDVALAVNADGVHIGQSDMPIAQARALLPSNAIIGVSCNTPEHARAAVRDGADYVGIGSIYGTRTKKLDKPLVGVRGVGAILKVLEGTQVKAVAIGGINSRNALRVLHGAVSSSGRSLDGLAVVSDIMASREPYEATAKLSDIILSFKEGRSPTPDSLLIPSGTKTAKLTKDDVLTAVTRLMEHVRELNPLVHQITNTVVATQSANVTLALGGSPIMATEAQEMEDLARICNSVLINIGTLRLDGVEAMGKAGLYANAFKKPVIFDPVGVGASAFRRETVRGLLEIWQPSVIKGNAGELASLAGSSEVESKGVDSVGFGFRDPKAFVRALAKKERCTVVLTGATDYISDGSTVIALKNGDEILGKITGSGCILGSSIATYCAAAAAEASEDLNYEGKLVIGNMFLGAIAGTLILTIGAELAVKSKTVKGPGTFLPGLIDALWTVSTEDVLKLAEITIEHEL